MPCRLLCCIPLGTHKYPGITIVRNVRIRKYDSMRNLTWYEGVSGEALFLSEGGGGGWCGNKTRLQFCFV